MSDCIFCKIGSGEIPTEVIYQSENIVGFKDLNPIAPTHILFIPKKHYETLNDVPAKDFDIFGDLMKAVTETAQSLGVAEEGYRVVTNVNRNAGQEVFHLHVHLIGGRGLSKMG
jgi:histidine triad (HIT) family protein